jgi:ligand-binding SRPBCC domain-containing protein
MKASIFEKSTILKASCEHVFAFHESPKNISKIAPSSLHVHEVACDDSAVTGGIFRIRASQFGIPIHWVGQWDQVEKPSLLVDTSLASPFAIWRHSHIFAPHPEGCLMTDRVEHRLKGGFLGAMVSRFLLPMFFAAMFHARHVATRRFFARSVPSSG